ncbi:oligosaccharide flippase family protein [Paractinoplanes lichenicola]|uniref:Polysaccharide biosynthesis C-terminal domain-containing protein n=1 Tax=Paractinoplanes lichenicola TaxID=2802976 RepID=A0ABS1W6E8_9ACTN|nr:polysaccharide biosynthesis C-terminal domain-containing protein [Actinoplanes lichenicola]MBL7262306.1 polysaccharide biosynthesis C-terminal domain-containing protein [Actinoplanes lichenicola]
MKDTETLPADRRPPMFRAAVQTYGSYLIASAGGLANVVLTARLLGADGRGEIAFLTTVASLVAFVASLSAYEAMINISGARPEERPALAGAGLVLTGVLGTLGAAGAGIIIWAVPTQGMLFSNVDIMIAVSAVPVSILQTYFLYLARASYDLAVASLGWISAPLATLALNVGFAATDGLTMRVAITNWVIGLACSALLLVAHVGRSSGFAVPSASLLKQVLGFGLRSHLGGVMVTGTYRLDHWLLGLLGSARELGTYSVAVAWFDAIVHLSRAVSVTFRPDLLRASAEDAGRQSARIFRICAVVVLVLVGGTVLIAPFLCVIVFGPEFSDSVLDLRILAFGAFGMMALNIFGTALVAQQRPMLESMANAAGFAVALVLYLVMIPPFGATGAAFASAISYLICGGVALGLVHRTLGLQYRSLVPRSSDMAPLVRLLRARKG